jgi:Cys-tRNA(Pro)/Cys-tRNA(Cys) deacylase
MPKTQKTNAMRLVETAGIPFSTAQYDVSDDNFDGNLVAQKLHLAPETVFKTLVLKGDKTGYLVCCIPVCKELNLKKVARASGNKSAEMIAVRELLPLTGYVRGGCSPVGMKKLFPTFIDETAQLFDNISVSAGMRGEQIILPPDALRELVQAQYADLTE